MNRTLKPLFAVLTALSLGSGVANVEFGLNDARLDTFRDAGDVIAACESEPSGFWCERQDESLTLIPTKGLDVFVDQVGEIVAAFAKPQKGQNISNYNLGNRQNLIPSSATLPGGAVLVDGAYLPPEGDIEANWQRIDDTTFEGTFRYASGDFVVERQLQVSSISHTLNMDVTVTRAAGGVEAETVQVVFPGIAGVTDPVMKVGQGEGDAGSHATNPLAQAVGNPSYISLQNNDRNTAFAIIMRPQEGADLQALPRPPRQIAMQATWQAGASDAVLPVTVYLGPNELVRYTQEGYADLPGLFTPNILGRISLGVLWALESIHDRVGNWGLSIIILTLLFRVLIWPLIQTQTKSMYGMQALQPKLQELQKKHKDDRETLTQETMKLYREAGVNPAGGCLPLLAQMPLFIILWRVFVNFEFAEGFLWVPDLGQADPYFILPILYVAIMFGMSYFSSRGNPQSFRQQVIINVVFAFILFGFPAGVLLYFVVSMGVQVLQYWLIQRGRPSGDAGGKGDGPKDGKSKKKGKAKANTKPASA